MRTTVKMICPMDRVNRVECCNVQCAQEGMCARSAEAGSAALVSDACINCATCGLPIGRSESTGQGLAGPTHLHVDHCVELLKADAARWRNAHDAIVKYAADKSEEASESLREAGAEITRLREENAALRETACRVAEIKKMLDDTRAHGPFSCARCNGFTDSIRQLVAENCEMREQRDALREDKARLDRLERELKHNPEWTACFLTISMSHDGKNFDAINVEFAEDFPNDEAVEMSNPTLRGALDKAFAHLDAARKGGEG